MERFDVKCPICGTINKGLYLKETEGHFECAKCKSQIIDIHFLSQKLPVLTFMQLTAQANK